MGQKPIIGVFPKLSVESLQRFLIGSPDLDSPPLSDGFFQEFGQHALKWRFCQVVKIDGPHSVLVLDRIGNTVPLQELEFNPRNFCDTVPEDPQRTEKRVARFDRYMLSQLLYVFGFFALVLILIYWINRAVRLFDQLISDGQSAWVFLEFSVLTLPGITLLVLPIAAAVAAIYVTNRLSQDSELTVMQATGFSSFRLARPIVSFAFLVAALVAILSHSLVPASARAYNARLVEVQQDIIAKLLVEGEFQNPTKGITVYIRDISPAGELIDIFISDTRQPDQNIIYTADRAFIVSAEGAPQLVLIQGNAQVLDGETQSLVTSGFDDFAYDISNFVDDSLIRARSLREFGSFDLIQAAPELLRETGETRASLHAQVHLRIGESLLAAAVILLSFATLMLSEFSRFGMWRQIVIAIFIVIFAKMIDTMMVSQAALNPERWPLAYVSFALGLCLSTAQLSLAAYPQLRFSRWRTKAKKGMA